MARNLHQCCPENRHLSTSDLVLKQLPQTGPDLIADSRPRRQFDFWMLAGIGIAFAATVAGIASAGIGISYFFQPTGLLIVVGGTLGVMFITTPRQTLLGACRRVRDLLWTTPVSKEDLIEELMGFARAGRGKKLLAIEPMIYRASSQFLEESLLMALDVNLRSELQSALENKLRLKERQGEADAKVLEVAGGFAPTIGVLGTVIGLIDVLREMSTLSSVGYGVGTAFVSTIYGLALANLVLLPASHRIRSRVAEMFEVHELIMEGVLCLFDGISPMMLRQRLNCFLQENTSR